MLLLVSMEVRRRSRLCSSFEEIWKHIVLGIRFLNLLLLLLLLRRLFCNHHFLHHCYHLLHLLKHCHLLSLILLRIRICHHICHHLLHLHYLLLLHSLDICIIWLWSICSRIALRNLRNLKGPMRWSHMLRHMTCLCRLCLTRLMTGGSSCHLLLLLMHPLFLLLLED